jgi:hypothetical protein
VKALPSAFLQVTVTVELFASPGSLSAKQHQQQFEDQSGAGWCLTAVKYSGQMLHELQAYLTYP